MVILAGGQIPALGGGPSWKNRMATCRVMSLGGGGYPEKMENLMAYFICELFLIIPTCFGAVAVGESL